MKMIGWFDKAPFCSHYGEYGIAEPFKDRTNLMSHVVDIVQQPRC